MKKELETIVRRIVEQCTTSRKATEAISADFYAMLSEMGEDVPKFALVTIVEADGGTEKDVIVALSHMQNLGIEENDEIDNRIYFYFGDIGEFISEMYRMDMDDEFIITDIKEFYNKL